MVGEAPTYFARSHLFFLIIVIMMMILVNLVNLERHDINMTLEGEECEGQFGKKFTHLVLDSPPLLFQP